MPSYGVNVSEDIAERIEEPLEYGDSRSERVRELLLVGLDVEDALEAEGLETYGAEHIADWVVEAIEEKAEREG